MENKQYYNKTQLHPEIAFLKHVFHRDMFAHYFRWSHVLKNLRPLLIKKNNVNILDIGCGNGNLAQTLYVNYCHPNKYLGIDIRKKTIINNIEKFKNVKWINFLQNDVIINNLLSILESNDWNIICCFEVIEHVGQNNVLKLLKNIYDCGNNNTVFYFSTPNFDNKIGAADNHIINGEIGELCHEQMMNFLEKTGFVIIEKFGTFASQKDINFLINKNEHVKFVYDLAKKYYDNELLSCFFAFLFPENARNCLWVCMKKRCETQKILI